MPAQVWDRWSFRLQLLLFSQVLLPSNPPLYNPALLTRFPYRFLRRFLSFQYPIIPLGRPYVFELHYIPIPGPWWGTLTTPNLPRPTSRPTLSLNPKTYIRLSFFPLLLLSSTHSPRTVIFAATIKDEPPSAEQDRYQRRFC
jgi:hypothetical protein